jgi:hypothetical protein
VHRLAGVLGEAQQVRMAAGVVAAQAGVAADAAPGSCLILSCARFEDEELAKQLAAEYTAATWHNHSPADIVGFFGGLELAGPGVTEARTWPRWPPEADDRNRHVLAGVGRVLRM